MNWIKGDINGVNIRPMRIFSDSRGWLAETFRNDELPEGFEPAMSYVSVTHPGETRGPHEHTGQTDLFCFAGPGSFMVRLWDNRKNSPTYGTTSGFIAGAENPCIVLIPPGVVHAYRNVCDIDAYCINYPDRLYAGQGRSEPVDEIRHEDADPQIFIF